MSPDPKGGRHNKNKDEFVCTFSDYETRIKMGLFAHILIMK